jgi:hypothetical protein
LTVQQFPRGRPSASDHVSQRRHAQSVPVNFVHGAIDRWRDVAAPGGAALSLAELAPRIRLGREIWNVQAFQMLRWRGYDVTLSGCELRDSINVVHRDDIDCIQTPASCFVVCVRADRDPSFTAQCEVVQNEWSLWRRSDVLVPHWPQPGLLPRDEERGARIENVAYFGKPDNLAPWLLQGDFQDELARRGFRFELRDDGWWDYRAVDVTLAVRTGERFYLDIKPASKLVNAWLAGCPAILSREAGYTQLRRSPLDYLEAGSPAGVLEALDRLRADPQLYHAMVENGRRRAAHHTHEAVADIWENVLFGRIQEQYERWRRRPAALRHLGYAVERVRRRLWGTHAVQRKKNPLHSSIYRLRRAVLLPRAF